ncbi:MAG: hypothetical protein N2318_10960 [Meiothermus sp.]|nr:hypothetical protein [Meiothermus sp.]
MSLKPFCAQIRRTQIADQTPQEKAQAAQVAASSIQQAQEVQTQTQAIRNSAQASATLGVAVSSGAITGTATATFVSALGSLNSQINARLQAGQSVDWVRGTSLTLPNYTTAQAKAHLANAISELRLSGNAQARGAIPLLGALLRYTARLERLSTGDWKTAAALQWAREMSLFGIPVKTTVTLRNGQLALGWASRFNAKLGNLPGGNHA